MSTTFNLTHESLERLTLWFKSSSSGLTGVNRVSHSQILTKLEAAVVESKFIYAVTLRYPTTTVESSAIKWMIKNVMPVKGDLDKFYKEVLGY